MADFMQMKYEKPKMKQSEIANGNLNSVSDTIFEKVKILVFEQVKLYIFVQVYEYLCCYSYLNIITK